MMLRILDFESDFTSSDCCLQDVEIVEVIPTKFILGADFNKTATASVHQSHENNTNNIAGFQDSWSSPVYKQ
jgi:hypothetical protein